MAGHRYWRLYITAKGSDPTFCNVAEIEFRESFGGSDATGSGTAAASSNQIPGTTDPDKAFDNNASTLWAFNTSVPQWISYDFGSGVTKDINEVTLKGISGAGYQTPLGWQLQYSDDNSNWTTSFTVDDNRGAFANSEQRVYSKPAASTTGTSTRWRIYVTAVQGGTGAGIAEVEMHTSIGGSNVCTGGTASASSSIGSFTPSAAFDSNNSTYWAASAAAPQWIAYTFGSTQAIREFSITSPGGTDVNLSPQNFELQFYDGVYWVPAITRKYEGFTASQKRTYSATYPTAAKQAWRLYITAVQTENPGVDELVMRSTPGGANQCTGGTPFGSGSQTASLVPANAFDGTGAFWYALNPSPQWVGYQFPAAVDIVQYLITAPGGGSQVNAPKTFKLQYEDGAGNWVDSHSVTNEPAWSAGETRTFGASTPSTRPVCFVCT